MSRLIIIRGNSGSGKTTIATRLHEALQPHHAKDLSTGVMLISQDVIRRDILRTKDTYANPSIQLIYDMAKYGHTIGYDIIIEGILVSERYGAMLHDVADLFDEVYSYYFDLSFEETLRRHEMKPNSHEFGEPEMREWFVENDFLGLADEKIFHDKQSSDEVFQIILNDLNIKMTRY